jgi:signal transduction histidine kinase/DNA-binding response OmpR family regulator
MNPDANLVDLDPNNPVSLFTEGVMALIALVTLAAFVRDRDRTRFEVALLFLLLAGGFRLVNELQPPRLFTVGGMLLLAKPCLVLRLVQHFRPVPRTVLGLAITGMVVSWAFAIATPPRTPPVHLAMGLFVIGYFVSAEAYIAQALVRGALAVRGVTRQRLTFAAVGSLLFAVPPVLEGIRIVAVGHTIAPAPWVQFLWLFFALAALSYYFGFAPPGWLRRAWQLSELERFLREGTGRSIGERARETLDARCPAAVRAVGGIAAAGALWDEAAQRLTVRTPAAYPSLSGSLAADDGAIGRAWRERRPAVAHTPSEFGSDDARLAAAVGASAMLAVPIATEERAFGLLLVFVRHRPLFAADDAALLRLFTEHSASAFANAALFDEQRRLNGRLRQVNADLERASRHKSEFLANMSHELRTPLNAIIGFSEVLLERLFGDLNEKQAEYVGDVVTSGRHLLSLINDIIDLSKVEAGRMDLELERFSLAGVLENGLTMVRERASRHGITLGLSVDPDIGIVEADERKVKQVVVNLLSNAVKFTPDGGRVDVAARLATAEVQVAIRDTGIGIAPADQERIFEAFQQAGRGPRGTQEGTGLGLTLSRRFVELHGGRIWLESQVGVGSTFTFTLPLRGRVEAVDRTAPAPPARDAARLEGTGPTVLVVEDDRYAIDLLTLYLSGAGFRVAVAHDGDEGLALAHGLHPAAITLDILLPRLDGWDFLVRAKADPAIADIPVIIVSILDARGRGLALGAADYLVKPAGPDDVLAALRRCILRAQVPAKPVTILAVDDDPVALELIRAVLEPEGYSVLTATGGQAGVALAQQALPALVILDLLMPDVDGFTVVERLRSDPATAAIPIIIMTAKSMSRADKERLNGQISHLARKGEFERDTFVALVQGLCQPVGA